MKLLYKMRQLDVEEDKVYGYALQVLDFLISTKEFQKFVCDVGGSNVNLSDLKELLGVFGRVHKKISAEDYYSDNDDDNDNDDNSNNDNNSDNDLKYLQTIFPNPKMIEDVIILQLKYDISYTTLSFSDLCSKLYAMNTLVLEEKGVYDHFVIVVFRKCKEQLSMNGPLSIQVLPQYSFTQESRILIKKEIAEIPSYLKNLLLKGDFRNAFSWLLTGQNAVAPELFLLERKNIYIYDFFLVITTKEE